MQDATVATIALLPSQGNPTTSEGGPNPSEYVSITNNAVIAGMNNHISSPASTSHPLYPSQSLPSVETQPSLPHYVAQASQENGNTWVKRVQNTVDEKLKNFSNPSLSSSGVPRVKIRDSIFQRSAKLHQDFILGIFAGKISVLVIFKVCSHIYGIKA